MFKVGDVKINSKVVLAPMAGITSLAYREFMKPFGVGLSFTEMVSDYGIIYENENTFDYIKSSEIDTPVGIQLFGHEEDVIIQAMKVIIDSGVKFDFFDINLGCPVHKVTNGGSGSAMLKDTVRLKEFMSKIVSSSPKPVTAKIRLGYDNEHINYKEVIKVLEEAHVALISIHARTAKQMYSGYPNYELLRNLRDDMNVPLVVSGNIFTLDDAISALEITHADGVMVARGGVGNPHLVKQIDTYFNTGERLPNISLKENVQNLLKFTDMLILEKGEYRAIRNLRGIAPKFLDGYPNMKKAKNEICQTINTKNDLIEILRKYSLI